MAKFSKIIWVSMIFIVIIIYLTAISYTEFKLSTEQEKLKQELKAYEIKKAILSSRKRQLEEEYNTLAKLNENYILEQRKLKIFLASSHKEKEMLLEMQKKYEEQQAKIKAQEALKAQQDSIKKAKAQAAAQKKKRRRSRAS